MTQKTHSPLPCIADYLIFGSQSATILDRERNSNFSSSCAAHWNHDGEIQLSEITWGAMSISGDCGEHETAGTLCLDHGADSTRATVTAGQNDWRLRTCGKNSSVVSTMRQQRSKTFAVTLVLIGLIGFSVGLATNQGRTRDQEHSFSVSMQSHVYDSSIRKKKKLARLS